MAIFDYECPDCGMWYYDVFTRNGDLGRDIDYICEECEAVLTRQFPTNTDFRLRGLGWAKDGYTER